MPTNRIFFQVCIDENGTTLNSLAQRLLIKRWMDGRSLLSLFGGNKKIIILLTQRITVFFFTSVATIITISKIMIKECLQRNPIDDVKNYNGGGRNNPALVRRIIIG